MGVKDFDPTSPWKKTPILYKKVLDIMNPVFIEKSILDEEYTIPQNFNLRPDLASYELFGTSKYRWVFANRNPDEIQDPINDFTAGKKIRIPSKAAVEKMK